MFALTDLMNLTDITDFTDVADLTIFLKYQNITNKTKV